MKQLKTESFVKNERNIIAVDGYKSSAVVQDKTYDVACKSVERKLSVVWRGLLDRLSRGIITMI